MDFRNFSVPHGNHHKDSTVQQETHEVSPSPPPITSSWHSHHSIPSPQSRNYLQSTTSLQWLRVGLALLITAVAVVVIALEAHTLKRYNDTRLVGWHLPLWPITLDLKPTISILIPATISAVAFLIYSILTVTPSRRSHPNLLVTLFNIATCISSIPVAFSIIYYPLYQYKIDPSTSRETIHSWTCKLSHGLTAFNADANILSLPSLDAGVVSVPTGFTQTCQETMIAWWLTVTLFILQIVACGLVGYGQVVEKKSFTSRNVNGLVITHVGLKVDSEKSGSPEIV